ncbi:MAG: hypothetical protein PVH88_17125 [Ignavibacteria bacterium]|jgi:hypothetical protein
MILKLTSLKRYFPVIIVSVLFFNSYNRHEIDNTIVLKIGELEITKYEFEKNMEKSIAEDNSKNILECKKEYIEKCMIIADAYEQHYDTLRDIRKEVQYMSNFMMLQKDGYLWQKTVSPIVDDFKKVTETKIGKRKRKFYFDYIYCNSREGLMNITGKDTVLENLNEYTKLKNKCQFHDFLRTGHLSFQWPFLPFWDYKEYIYKLKEGEVSHLLNVNNKYYYLYVDHIENIEITPQETNNLQKELQLGIEKEIDDKKTEEIVLKCKPVLNNENINAIIKFISEGRNISEFNDNPELIHYDLNDSLKKVNFKTFFEYYSYLPVKPVIRDKKTLTDFINQFFYDDYLRDEAEKLGLYNSEKFLLDRKNFKNNVIYEEYLENNVISKIKTDPSEISVYYEKNKAQFIQPKIVTFDMYVFEKEIDANMNAHTISNFINTNQKEKARNPSVIKGLVDFIPNTKINLETDTSFSKEFVDGLLTLKVSMLSSYPVRLNNKYVLFYKIEEQGQSIKSLKNVHDRIENKIRNEKSEMRTREIIKELSRKYKIEIDKTGIE